MHLLIFQDIIDSVCSEINHILKAVTNLESFQLLCCDRNSAYSSQFPDRLMTKLRYIYSGMFDYNRLKSEFEVAYSLPEFSQKPIHNVL